MSQQHPAQNQPPQQWVQQPPPKKKHTVCKVFGGVLGAIVAVVIIVAVTTSGGDSTQSAAPAPATHEKDASDKKPGAKPVDSSKVTFKVSGESGSGLDVTYGSDSDNRQGGSSAPWKTSLKVDNDANLYSITAQLQGKGDITCSVTIGDVTAKGHASGSYNVCDAELDQSPFGGWEKL